MKGWSLDVLAREGLSGIELVGLLIYLVDPRSPYACGANTRIDLSRILIGHNPTDTLT